MDPHEFKWGWDAKKKSVHHWPSSERARRTHRDDFASLIGRDVRIQGGDVMGHGTYLPEERTEDGNVVGPPTVLLRSTYGAEIPTAVLHHFENVYPATEVRRGHKHEHPPTHHEARVEWVAPMTGAEWARANFAKVRTPDFKMSPIKTSAPEWRVAAADMEGAMVAVFIPEATGKKIQIDGGEPVDNMHITLAYFSDKAADRDDWDKVATVVERIAEKHGTLEGKIGGYGVFKGETGDVLWAAPDVPGLAELRHELITELETEGFDLNEEHGWSPHITLKYDWKGDFPDMAEPIDVTFDQLTFAQGEKKNHKRMARTAMAERSGDPELDKLIEEFYAENPVEAGYVDPDLAPEDYSVHNFGEDGGIRGLCHALAQMFADFLTARGITSWSTEEDAKPGNLQEHTPEAWGYSDREVPGADYHVVTKVQMPSGVYMVDWTAAQYGYEEFPMVQKLDDASGWQRDWTAKMASSMGNWTDMTQLAWEFIQGQESIMGDLFRICESVDGDFGQISKNEQIFDPLIEKIMKDPGLKQHLEEYVNSKNERMRGIRETEFYLPSYEEWHDILEGIADSATDPRGGMFIGFGDFDFQPGDVTTKENLMMPDSSPGDTTIPEDWRMSGTAHWNCPECGMPVSLVNGWKCPNCGHDANEAAEEEAKAHEEDPWVKAMHAHADELGPGWYGVDGDDSQGSDSWIEVQNDELGKRLIVTPEGPVDADQWEAAQETPKFTTDVIWDKDIGDVNKMTDWPVLPEESDGA